MAVMHEHLIAWIIYLIAFIPVYWYWGRMVRFVPFRVARQMLKGLLAVLLLVPVSSAQLDGWWAPAWLHFLYSFLLDDGGEMGRALFNLVLGAVGMLFVLALDSGWYHWRRRH